MQVAQQQHVAVPAGVAAQDVGDDSGLFGFEMQRPGSNIERGDDAGRARVDPPSRSVMSRFLRVVRSRSDKDARCAVQPRLFITSTRAWAWRGAIVTSTDTISAPTEAASSGRSQTIGPPRMMPTLLLRDWRRTIWMSRFSSSSLRSQLTEKPTMSNQRSCTSATNSSCDGKRPDAQIPAGAAEEFRQPSTGRNCAARPGTVVSRLTPLPHGRRRHRRRSRRDGA